MSQRYHLRISIPHTFPCHHVTNSSLLFLLHNTPENILHINTLKIHAHPSSLYSTYLDFIKHHSHKPQVANCPPQVGTLAVLRLCIRLSCSSDNNICNPTSEGKHCAINFTCIILFEISDKTVLLQECVLSGTI